MNEQNLLENNFLEETLQEICETHTDITRIKENYAPGSVRRRKAVIDEVQVEQVLELFAAAKELDMYIDEQTTGRQLIEARFGMPLETLQQLEKRPAFLEKTKKVTQTATNKTLDVTFQALGSFGDWLGAVTSSRRK